MAGGWIAEAASTATLERVAGDLGIAIRRKHLSACPSCNVEKHGSGKIYRGESGDRWHCHRCGADGDAVSLVAWTLCGTGEPSPDQWVQVREWFEGRGYLTRNTPRSRFERVSAPSHVKPQTKQPESVEPPRWPETESVRALWRIAEPVSEQPEGAAWLALYGIPGVVVDGLSLARILRKTASVPSWARCAGHSWVEGWRLLIPIYGPEGRCVSLAARWAIPGDPLKGAKECTPAGFTRSGGVYADPMALALLHGKTEDGGCRWNGEVVIVEGGKDYLTWAARAGRITMTDDGPETFAVFGVWAGAWSADIAARIPDGATVSIRTDQNEAGDKYAEAIAETLHKRCKLERPTRERYAE